MAPFPWVVQLEQQQQDLGKGVQGLALPVALLQGLAFNFTLK